MSGHRLIVRRGGRTLSQGTAFWVRADCVVTALHVVIEEDPSAQIHVAVGSAELLLTPLLKDARADLVLLRAERTGEPLALVEISPNLGARWSANGFPAEEGGEPFSLTGTLAARYAPEQARGALQLTVEQGTLRNWEGMSGAPVLVDGRVVGVITAEKDAANTMWAASAEALWSLLALHDRFEAAAALLDALYSPQTLPALARDLGVPSAEVAEILRAARAAGEVGLRRLLEEMRQDFPQHAGLRALAVEGQGGLQGRKRLLAEICQKLDDQQGTGVALIVPQGFDGTRLAEAALDALAPSFLILRLVPPREAVEEARLYPSLLGFLRQSLEMALGLLDPAWATCLPPPGAPANEEVFRACLAGLLEGPVRRSGRRLLLAVDGLSRLPEEQRRRWGYTMAALGRREGWRLLVWGGEELHLLCHKAGGEGAFSVFHSLHPVSVPPLDRAEVGEALAASLGAVDALTADRVFSATGGHPALVAELLEMWPDGAGCPELVDLDAAVEGSLTLERAGASLDQKAKDALARLIRAGGNASPFALGLGGQRLRWLGLAVEDHGQLRILAPGVSAWAKGALP